MNKQEPFSIKITDNYILATCYGRRTVISEVIHNAEIIFKSILTSQKQAIMLDYREVDFHFPMSDAFNLTRLFELKLKQYTHLKMAVVLSEEHQEFGQFSQEVGQKRGLNLKTFQHIEHAKEWLERNEG